MKMKTFFLLSLLTATVSESVTAKEISMYEQPLVGSKAVSKIDLEKGVIPIFTQKDGKWVKIADPSNGNVGWVPASELNANPHTSFSFTQRILDKDSKGKETYQVYQFGPKPLTPEQIKSMQQQQQAIQQSIQKNMQDLIQNMNTLYKQQNIPLMMPVIFVPSEK